MIRAFFSSCTRALSYVLTLAVVLLLLAAPQLLEQLL